MSFTLIIATGCSLAVGVKVYNKVKPNQPLKSLLHSAADRCDNTLKNTIENLSKRDYNSGVRYIQKRIIDYRYGIQEDLSHKKDTVNTDIDPIETRIKKDYAISTVSLGLTLAGSTIYPPAMVMGVAGLLFLLVPIWEKGAHDLFKRRRVTRMVVESIVLPGAIITGHYVAVALTYWFLYYSLNLMAKAKGNTTKTLGDAFNLSSHRSVWILQGGNEVEIELSQVKAGDITVVQAGEVIPVDGVITSGSAAIDQHMLTGESQFVEKEAGEKVLASTVLLSGRILVEVKKTGQETTAAQVSTALNEMTEFTDLVELRSVDLADRFSLPYLALGSLATAMFGPHGGIAVLYFPLDDALYSAGPLGVLNYLNVALNKGIMIKDGRALESMEDVDTIVFDKTGTLTQEQPILENIHSIKGFSDEDILRYAAIAEHKQSHPIALAILDAAKKFDIDFPSVLDAAYEVGYGLEVQLSGDEKVHVGSARFMAQQGINIPKSFIKLKEESDEHGYSFVFVALNEKLIGALELHPTIRSEAREVVSELKSRGYEIHVISGDNEKPTRNLVQKLGIEKYHAEILPEGKAEIIKDLQSSGKKVCFIGDGINDAIALKQAEVSISIHGASTIATDTAQIVLMKEDLRQLIDCLDLSKGLTKNLKRTFWAGFIPSVVIVGGVFVLNLGFSFAITCYLGGMLLSVGNAMSPQLKDRLKAKEA